MGHAGVLRGACLIGAGAFLHSLHALQYLLRLNDGLHELPQRALLLADTALSFG